MNEKPNSELLHSSIPGSLEESMATLKTILHAPLNEDAIFREYGASGVRVCAVYIEGMADETKIGEFVLRALKGGARDDETSASGSGAKSADESDAKSADESDAKSADESGAKSADESGAKSGGRSNATSADGGEAKRVRETLLEIAQLSQTEEYASAVRQILSGMTCLLIDGAEGALMLETRSYPHRAVEKPTNELVVNGPQEAFNEHLRTNITLLRRYVQSPELICEKLDVGVGVPTQVALVYLRGVASEELIAEARRRLLCIQSPTVMGAGELQQLIEDRPFSLLPQMLQTERPDRAASCLTDGQIAILVENSPYALLAPATFFHLIHASDDSFLRWQYASAVRVIRVAGLLISLLLPALYIAMSIYHNQLIPMALLTSIAESRANVPFPIVVEVLFMEFSFFLLNEAGLRTPTQIGSAFGIVGALILGQTAVSASVISPILIIIVALTGLGNYVVPNYELGNGVILYRLLLIACSALLGLYGLMIGTFLIVLHLCSIRSFGVEFFAPASPRRRHNPDLLWRLPIWTQKRALFYARRPNWLHREAHP